MSYEKIVRQKISELIPQKQFDILKKNRAIIAGGFFTSIFSGAKVNDIDIYFKTKEDVVSCVKEFYKNNLAWFLFVTEKSLTMNLDMSGVQTKIQFVSYDFFNDCEGVFKHSDFTCCMAAYDLEHDSIVMHDDFILSVSQRRLSFDGETRFPLNTLNRVDKYEKRGYSITGHQLMKIGIACSQVKLESWDDVREQVGGVYGMTLREDLPEFSTETLLKEIGTLFTKVNSSPDFDVFEKAFGFRPTPVFF